MKILEELEQRLKKIEDTRAHRNFQIQNPYSTFQVLPQQEEPTKLDESMKNLIQAENYFIQLINRLEAQMNHLTNIVKDRDEETLPNTFLTIRDCPTYIDRNEESWCLKDFDQDSISSHQFELDQSQPLDQLASFNFNAIRLDCKCEPDSQFYDLVSNFEFMLTSVSLPNLDSIPGRTLILVPI